MEKRANRVIYVLQWIAVFAFFSMLSFPIAFMSLNGPEEHQEVLAEEAVELQPVSFRTYVTGTFHENFAAWFAQHLSYRYEMISLHRRMLYHWEMSKPSLAAHNFLYWLGGKQAPPIESTHPDGQGSATPTEPTPDIPKDIYTDPGNIYAEVNQLLLDEQPIEPKGFKGAQGICIGKSGYLYQQPYMDEYYGNSSDYTSITKEGIEQTVRQLEYIQEELWVRYDITMIYLISPNKVSMYEQYVPDYYRYQYLPNENYVRPVDMLRDALKDSRVLYVDSVEHYHNIGLLNTFTKTGTHWNHLASFEATAEAVRLYEQYGASPVKTMQAVRVLSQAEPISDGENTNNDADIYHILYDAMENVPGKIMDEEYFYPEVAVQNANAAPIRVLLQGGSFATDIDFYLRTYQIAQVRYIHYNGIRHRNTWEGDDPWSRGNMIWEKILDDLDLIIFEVNENYIRSKHCSGNNWETECGDHSIGSNATYDSLYAFLKATE